MFLKVHVEYLKKMWKFVSRGIRDSIGRRACRTNIYSQSSQDPPEAKQSKIVKNCQYKRCIVQSFSSFYHGFYGKSRYLGAKDKQDKNKYDAKYTWTDAVGWVRKYLCWKCLVMITQSKTIHQNSSSTTYYNVNLPKSNNNL